MTWGFGWENEEMDHIPAKSRLEIAAERGDEAMIRAMLIAGMNPYGELDSVRPNFTFNFHCGPSHLRGLMPMIAAAKNWNVGAARILIEGGFKCSQLRWLLIIGTVLNSRDESVKSGDPTTSPTTIYARRYRNVQHSRDVKFWQELVNAEVIDLQHAVKGCQCSQRPMTLPASHKTSATVETGRKFASKELQVHVDERPQSQISATGPFFVVATHVEN